VRVDRWAQGDFGRLPALAKELVEQRPDAIFVAVTEAVPSAMKATRSIPIVAVAIGDPVDLGFAKSFARPGVNLTGVTASYPEANGKREEGDEELHQAPAGKRPNTVCQNVRTASMCGATSSAGTRAYSAPFRRSACWRLRNSR